MHENLVNTLNWAGEFAVQNEWYPKKLIPGNVIIESSRDFKLMNLPQYLLILNSTFLLTSLYLFRLDAVKYFSLQRAQRCDYNKISVISSRYVLQFLNWDSPRPLAAPTHNETFPSATQSRLYCWNLDDCPSNSIGVLLSLFYKWGNWGSYNVSNSPKVRKQ